MMWTWTFNPHQVPSGTLTWWVKSSKTSSGFTCFSEYDAHKAVLLKKNWCAILTPYSAIAESYRADEEVYYTLVDPVKAVVSVGWKGFVPAEWTELGTRDMVTGIFRFYVLKRFVNGTTDKGTYSYTKPNVGVFGFEPAARVRYNTWVDLDEDIYRLDVAITGVAAPTQSQNVAGAELVFHWQADRMASGKEAAFKLEVLSSWTKSVLCVTPRLKKEDIKVLSARTRHFLELPTSVSCRRGST